MAHVIAQPCIGSKEAACYAVCPVECIHPTPGEPDFAEVDQLFINPLRCIDCGLCVDECPVLAIFPEQDLPEAWVDYIDKNAAYFEDDATEDDA